MNPYQPPNATSPTPDTDTAPKFLASLVPATLAIGLTLFIWVALVSTLDGFVAQRFSMLAWSITLFLATSLAILAVTRAWRKATNPMAFVAVFSIFCLVFLIAEGDVSNGTDLWNMAIVYGTLLVLPIAAFRLAGHSGRNRGQAALAPSG